MISSVPHFLAADMHAIVMHFTKEDRHMRFVANVTVALSVAFAAGLYAQDQTVKSTTKVTGDNVKAVTYTGCLQSGTEARTFILDKVVPVGQSTKTEVGTAGEITKTTTTTYALIPGEKVEFQPLVGHKVEVTGVLISGDTKTETKTKVEREGEKDVTTKDKMKTDNAMPQLRVTSVKHLADSCVM
jgi:hypothetical protein